MQLQCSTFHSRLAFSKHISIMRITIFQPVRAACLAACVLRGACSVLYTLPFVAGFLLPLEACKEYISDQANDCNTFVPLTKSSVLCKFSFLGWTCFSNSLPLSQDIFKEVLCCKIHVHGILEYWLPCLLHFCLPHMMYVRACLCACSFVFVCVDMCMYFCESICVHVRLRVALLICHVLYSCGVPGCSGELYGIRKGLGDSFGVM